MSVRGNPNVHLLKQMRKNSLLTMVVWLCYIEQIMMTRILSIALVFSLLYGAFCSSTVSASGLPKSSPFSLEIEDGIDDDVDGEESLEETLAVGQIASVKKRLRLLFKLNSFSMSSIDSLCSDYDASRAPPVCDRSN